jgi:hypothetical protein
VGTSTCAALKNNSAGTFINGIATIYITHSVYRQAKLTIAFTLYYT